MKVLVKGKTNPTKRWLIKMLLKAKTKKDSHHNGQQKKDSHHNGQKKKDSHHNGHKKDSHQNY